jgi:hypothetical protein
VQRAALEPAALVLWTRFSNYGQRRAKEWRHNRESSGAKHVHRAKDDKLYRQNEESSAIFSDIILTLQGIDASL